MVFVSFESLAMELRVLTSLHCAQDRVGLSRDVGCLRREAPIITCTTARLQTCFDRRTHPAEAIQRINVVI